MDEPQLLYPFAQLFSEIKGRNPGKGRWRDSARATRCDRSKEEDGGEKWECQHECRGLNWPAAEFLRPVVGGRGQFLTDPYQVFPALLDKNFMKAGSMSTSSWDPNTLQTSNKYLVNPLTSKTFSKEQVCPIARRSEAPEVGQSSQAGVCHSFSSAPLCHGVGPSVPAPFSFSAMSASPLSPPVPALWDVLWTEPEPRCKEAGKLREIQANLMYQVNRHSHPRIRIQLSCTHFSTQSQRNRVGQTASVERKEQAGWLGGSETAVRGRRAAHHVREDRKSIAAAEQSTCGGCGSWQVECSQESGWKGMLSRGAGNSLDKNSYYKNS